MPDLDPLLNRLGRFLEGGWPPVFARSRDNPPIRHGCAQLGKQAPMFLYEDICEDPLGFVNEVLKLMDLPPHEGAIGDTGVKVLRDDISRQWRDRYVAHV